ncbi:hypothetical protein TNCV_516041 [Trichonephila clavipes]|nr:hypothetical protein TNCV_516041 [Trichonephila clavipes]
MLWLMDYQLEIENPETIAFHGLSLKLAIDLNVVHTYLIFISRPFSFHCGSEHLQKAGLLNADMELKERVL